MSSSLAALYMRKKSNQDEDEEQPFSIIDHDAANAFSKSEILEAQGTVNVIGFGESLLGGWSKEETHEEEIHETIIIDENLSDQENRINEEEDQKEMLENGETAETSFA